MTSVKAKNPVYPLLSIIASVIVLVTGLVTAKTVVSAAYVAGVWLLLLVFGYWRCCLAVIPFAAIMSALFCGVTYALSNDTAATFAAANRILAVSVAVIPGLALEPVLAVRNLSGLRAPRMITLGMMIALGFFPLLKKETARVREAMRTRGAGNALDPRIFHRAFLVPLVVRLVNISDTLALSVETRGFDASDKNYTVYKEIKFRLRDAVFAFLLAAGSVTAVVVCML